MAVVLSFYSPSGYKVVDTDSADLVIYLPADLPSIMRPLVVAMRPSVYVMVKYDYWYNLLLILQKRSIPQVVIAAAYKRDSFLFRWYGSWFSSILKKIDRIYVQTQDDQARLLAVNYANVAVGGDTRVDRSAALPDEDFDHPALSQVTSGSDLVFIYGSIWPDDVPVVSAIIQHYPDGYHLIAPHEVDDVSFITEITPSTTLWSSGDLGQITIVDKIGILKYLYRYADVVYIGGGMHGALHNTLEPAAYHVPLLVGGNGKASNFSEVNYFIEAGVCRSVNSPASAIAAVARLLQLDDRALTNAYRRFFASHKADVDGIIQYISSHARS
jgi:3-deoxy-D-manno-octulosonic-acid transferase